MIEVKQTQTEDSLQFSVTITDGNGVTQHQVTMSQATYESLTGGEWTPVECVRAAFRFLLDREPKESILSTFDIPVISRYFPSFEQDLSGYL
jgi:hypothetical protein